MEPPLSIGIQKIHQNKNYTANYITFWPLLDLFAL